MNLWDKSANRITQPADSNFHHFQKRCTKIHKNKALEERHFIYTYGYADEYINKWTVQDN